MSSLSNTKTGRSIGLSKSKKVALRSAFVIKAPSEYDKSNTRKLLLMFINLFTS